jgi:tetraprenyl-beta-curcumene synthase
MPDQATRPFAAKADTHVVSGGRPAVAATSLAARPRASIRMDDLALAATFTGTVVRYLTTVLPAVTRELRHWQTEARLIPDPALRANALEALGKRGNIEGAALFAVLAPRSHRRQSVRALVAFQTAYNYLDTLAEQPSADPVANGAQLHQALLTALDPPAEEHPDYYAYHPRRRDGGFLTALVKECGCALATLPSRTTITSSVWDAAARIVAFQSLNLTERQGGHGELERWARLQTPRGSGLEWWQTAGAGGSSLAVHALIAAAANPSLDPGEVAAIERAYFPWICALHSLLDSLVDVAEDQWAGQRNLLSYHGSPGRTAFAMKMLARRCAAAVSSLPDALTHQVILAAMASYYLSSPDASTPDASSTVAGVAAVLGRPVGPALALFRGRRLAGRVTHGSYT